MASFKEFCFTPGEFARLARVDKEKLALLEEQGLLQTIRRRMGNVDRKMIPLEAAQEFFRVLRRPPEVPLPEHVQRAIDQETAQETAHETDQNTAHETNQEAAWESVATATDQPIGAPTDQAAAEALYENANEPSSQPPAGAEFAGRRGDPIFDIDSARKLMPDLFTRPTGPGHRVQMFYNVKGGTGKSTLTAQYVMRAAMMGFNILAIDLDGQGHLTVNLDVLDAHERASIYDVLINDLPLRDAIMNVAPGLDLVPANLGLCNIEVPLNQKPRREYRLSEAIASVADQYDLIVADTNPAASILNCSMLVAADLVNVVCATNPLSFHGMSLVMATLGEMEREFRKQLAIRIIPNMYDSREVVSQEVLGELRSQFPESCTKTVVNRSADLNEATKRRTTVWDVSGKNTAAQDIDALTQELLYVDALPIN